MGVLTLMPASAFWSADSSATTMRNDSPEPNRLNGSLWFHIKLGLGVSMVSLSDGFTNKRNVDMSDSISWQYSSASK